MSKNLVNHSALESGYFAPQLFELGALTFHALLESGYFLCRRL